MFVSTKINITYNYKCFTGVCSFIDTRFPYYVTQSFRLCLKKYVNNSCTHLYISIENQTLTP